MEQHAAMSPYEEGADLAQRFIRQQAQAGRTAEQITVTDAYITGPLRDRARTNEAAEEAARGREAAARFLSIWRDATADEIEQAAAAAGLKSLVSMVPTTARSWLPATGR